MERLTFKQAFDLITIAYIKDEIIPMDAEFCFCGTLTNRDTGWRWWYITTPFQYSQAEFRRMEQALFVGIRGNSPYNRWMSYSPTEDQLFNGMVAALDVLKQIHVEHGEVIQEDITLQKRQLKTSTV